MNSIPEHLPVWYKTEKDAERTIQHLTTTEDFRLYLENPDPFIRRLAILRIGRLKHKDSYTALHRVLDDSLEMEENKKLAALLMCKLNKELDLGFFISHPFLAEFSGNEDLDQLLNVSIINPLPDLRFHFKTAMIESQLHLDNEMIKSGIDEKKEYFPFPLRQWIVHFYSNLPHSLLKNLKTCLRGAAKFLTHSFPQKMAALFSSLFIKLKARKVSRADEVLPCSDPSPQIFQSSVKKTKIKSVTYKPRQRYTPHIPLSVRIKGISHGLIHLLFFPFRFLLHYKYVVLVTLAVLYGLFSFTTPGKSFLFRINPQAYYLNTRFLERSENWIIQLINSNQTLAAVLKTQPAPEPTSEQPGPAPVKKLVVTASKGLYLRKEPLSSGAKLCLMKQNTTVEYLGVEDKDASGGLWYKIRVNQELMGWANAQYLKEWLK